MGNKYGKQHRAEQRRDTRTQVAAHAAAAAWKPDPDRATEQFEDIVYASGTALVMQRVVRYRDSAEVVEFAIVYTDAGGEVLCIDTCNHGSVHRHRNGNHTSHEVIAEVDSQAVVQNALWEAIGEALTEAYSQVEGEGFTR